MTDDKATPHRLPVPVRCPICQRTHRGKGSLIIDLEHHGVIQLARLLTKIPTDHLQEKREHH